MGITLQPQAMVLVPNFDGTLDGAWPNGDKPLNLTWNPGSLPNLSNQPLGTAVSFNARAALVGDAGAVANAVITVVFVSGSSSSGWTSPGAGTNCTNPGTAVGAGVFVLRATYLGLTRDSLQFNWSFVASPPPPGGIVLAPGNYWRLSTAPGLESFATISGYIDAAHALDVNNKCAAMCLQAQWGDLEIGTAPANINDTSPSRYDGHWDSSGERGFAKLHKIVNKLKSLSPPSKFFLLLNMTGNGLSGTFNGFDASFAPAYLNSSTYSGGEWTAANTSPPLSGVRVIIQDANVQRRMVALVSALYTEFGPDTATGGIFAIDLCNEITASSGTLNNETFVPNCANILFPGVRAAAPKLLMTLRPTFLNGNSAQNQYQPLFQAMIANKIACANEDLSNNITGTNHHMSWVDQAYLGMFNGAAQPGWPNHAALKDWYYIGNVEMAELSKSDSGTIAVPPANVGSGYIYSTPTAGGIMDGVKNMNANGVIWLVRAFGGPNVNRGTFFSGAPANPTPGPGAGLVAAHPNIMDTLSDNTSYAGVIAGGCDVPNKTRPASW